MYPFHVSTITYVNTKLADITTFGFGLRLISTNMSRYQHISSASLLYCFLLALGTWPSSAEFHKTLDPRNVVDFAHHSMCVAVLDTPICTHTNVSLYICWMVSRESLSCSAGWSMKRPLGHVLPKVLSRGGGDLWRCSSMLNSESVWFIIRGESPTTLGGQC